MRIGSRRLSHRNQPPPLKSLEEEPPPDPSPALATLSPGDRPEHRVSNVPMALAQPPIGRSRQTMSHFTLMRFLPRGGSCRLSRAVAHGSLLSTTPDRSSVARRYRHLRMNVPHPVFGWGSHHSSGLLAWGPTTSRAVPRSCNLTAQSSVRTRGKA